MVNKIREIIENARKEKRIFLLEHESKTIIKEISLQTTDFQVASNITEAQKIAKEYGYPLVMKIISPQIIHKTDAGGVKLNIQNDRELRQAYDDILVNIKKYNPKAVVYGVLIEKMVKPSVEIIIGVTRDPTFGPAIMFGLGGIFVELLKDVSFRITPLEEKDANEMIKEIKALPLLQGYRGGPKVDLKLIVNALLKVSKLSIDYINEIQEIDLNPIFAYENKLVTVDARIILTQP